MEDMKKQVHQQLLAPGPRLLLIRDLTLHEKTSPPVSPAGMFSMQHKRQEKSGDPSSFLCHILRMVCASSGIL